MPETKQTTSREYAKQFTERFNIDPSVSNQKAIFEWAILTQKENEELRENVDALTTEMSKLKLAFTERTQEYRNSIKKEVTSEI